MADYATAFREYIPDSEPSDWTSQWEATTMTVRQSVFDSEPRVIIPGPTADRCAMTFDPVDSDADRDDAEILFLTVPRYSFNYNSGLLRVTGAASTEKGYFVTIVQSIPRIDIRYRIAGGAPVFIAASGTLPARTGVHGEPTWCRFRVNGTSLKAKLWRESISEPSAWSVEATDSNVAGVGGVGLTSEVSIRDLEFYYFSCATNGGTAIGPETFGPSLHEIANDPEIPLEYTAEIDYRDIGGAADKTLRIGTAARATGASDLPASVPFEGLLEPPVGSGAGLSGDLEFDTAPNQFRLEARNKPVEQGGAGPLDFLVDDSVSGRSATLRIGGRNSSHHRSFSRWRSATVSGEPEITDERARFNLESVPRNLREPLDVKRYAGIPTCLRQMNTSVLGRAQASHISAYDLTSFTCFARVRLESASTTAADIFFKQLAAATDRNYLFRVNSSGGITGNCSSGGVANDVNMISTASLVDDGEWHWAAWSLLDGEKTYLLVDGNEEATDTTIGTPDTQTAHVNIASGTESGYLLCDCRLINEYMSQDEVRAMAEVAWSGDGTITTDVPTFAVAYWPLNDTSGSVATDYSTNANDGTVDGVENTDYEWFETDLGEVQLGGTTMPMAHGAFVYGHAQLVDSGRERYRFTDINNTNPTDDWFMRNFIQGVDTATIFTDRVFEFASSTDEPVSYFTIPAAAGFADVNDWQRYPAEIVQDIMTRRAGIPVSEFDESSLGRMRELAPLWTGLHVPGGTSPLTSNQVIEHFLKGLGGHYRLDRYGRFVFDFLFPPIGPGPDGTVCAEFMGAHYGLGVAATDDYNPEIVFGDVTDLGTGSCTLACWFKPLAYHHYRNEVTTGGPTDSLPIGLKLVEHQHRLQIVRQSDNFGGLIFGSHGITPTEWISWQGIDTLDEDSWYFLAGVYDSVGNTHTMYLAKQGESLVQIASRSSLGGTLQIPGDVLRIGGTATSNADLGRRSYVGGLQHVQTYNSTKTLSALQALMDNHPTTGTANIAAWVPFTQGSGYAIEEVSGGRSAMTGARWSPQLDLDLSLSSPKIQWDYYRTIPPVNSVVVNYNPNFGQIDRDSIAVSVTDADAITFTRSSRSRELPISANDTSYDEKRTLEVFIAAIGDPNKFPTAVGEDSPGNVTRHWANRSGRKRTSAGIVGVDRRALSLVPNGELRITDSRYGLSAGKNFRIVGIVPRGFGPNNEPRFSLAIWG